MRVLHVVESLDLGGAERVITDLVVNMPAEVESYVCCLKHTGAMATRLPSTVPVIELLTPEGNHPGSIFQLASIIRQNEIDIVHGHNWNTFLESGFAAMFAGGIPVVHTIHGMYTAKEVGMAGTFKQTLRRFIERRLAARCCKLCTVSEAIRAYVVPDLGVNPQRVETIINGVTAVSNPLESGHALSTSFEDKSFVMCFVGRLAPEKNLLFLLSIMPDLLDAVPGARLLIVGDGSERNALQAYCLELGITDSVQFFGFQPEPQNFLRQAKVFVLPSQYEGISIALLEAQSAGLPAVVTDVGGNSEIVKSGENGFLVPLDDSQAFLAALIRLASDRSLWCQMSKNGKKRVDEKFNIRTAASRYLNVYQACLEGRTCA